jgi:DNA polymerase-3 subunit epsilon
VPSRSTSDSTGDSDFPCCPADARVLAGVFRGSLTAAEELGLALPLVACPPKQGSGYPPRMPKTPCAFRNPGPLTEGSPLVQGMKIAFTGDTATSREELVARSVAAGLNVTGSVSRHTSALVTNERDSDTGKARAARAAGAPVITEITFLDLLAHVQPGAPHQVPEDPAPEGTPVTVPRSRSQGPAASTISGPLSGRRILVLGGPHDQAASMRTRIVELGGAAAVNLSARVTDVIVLAGGDNDRRMPRITTLGLPTHDATWLETTHTPTPSESTAGTAQGDAPIVHVLPRGGVIDLPHPEARSSWTVTATWEHQTPCDIDVVAFTLDEDEQVSCDEDFVFYGAPESPDGSVRLTTDGPTEQAITADLGALPTAARKVVIAAAIDGPADFGDLGAIEITITPGTGERPLAQATLDAATTERTLLLAELYRRGPIWRARAVGQGYDHALATLARHFGVDVID